jgi:uncharacterized protein with FMN-binding domain
MTKLAANKTAVAVIAGLSLAGALAGCAPTAQAPSDTSKPSSEPSTAPSTVPEAGTGTSTSTYKDGEYTESGSYASPNGTASGDVTVTLADDVVTAVEVVGHGDNPDSKHYQGEFIGGIDAAVVGKKIDDIKVTNVAGSSLTSGGFTEALDAIKADAAS